jgi:L-threonylcarbamoyladenylate synthase
VRERRLLIFPTDTIYGLGCNAFHEEAIQRVYELKGRPPERPLSVHLGSVAEIERYAVISGRQWALIKRLLPGPYTVVLEASENAPPACISPEGKIGLRVPASRSFQMISEAAGRPLVGTSVNRSGEPPLTDVDEIIVQFGDDVDLIIATDEPMSHASSAVIDLTAEPPRALRGELPQELLH